MNNTIRQTIIHILKESQSVVNVIAYFESENLLQNYKGNPYCIPAEDWENVTDIPIECVDLLPVSMDGSIYMNNQRTHVFLHKSNL